MRPRLPGTSPDGLRTLLPALLLPAALSLPGPALQPFLGSPPVRQQPLDAPWGEPSSAPGCFLLCPWGKSRSSHRPETGGASGEEGTPLPQGSESPEPRAPPALETTGVPSCPSPGAPGTAGVWGGGTGSLLPPHQYLPEEHADTEVTDLPRDTSWQEAEASVLPPGLNLCMVVRTHRLCSQGSPEPTAKKWSQAPVEAGDATVCSAPPLTPGPRGECTGLPGRPVL